MTSRPVEKEERCGAHRDKREFIGLELQEIESLICVKGDKRARGKKVGLQSEIVEGNFQR